MRIAVLVKTDVGAQWLLPQIKALRESGAAVLCCIPVGEGPLGASLSEVGADVTRTAALQPLSFSTASHTRRLVDELERFAPDAISSHLYRSAVVGRHVAARLGVPHVHSVAGPLYLDSRLIREWERRHCRLDARIICSSSDIYRRYRGLGVSHERLVVVPYGTDLSGMHPDAAPSRAEARALLDLDGQEFVAVTVAYFYPRRRYLNRGKPVKGHDVLFAAWKQASARGRIGTLLIIGSGWGPAGQEERRAMIAAFDLEHDQSVRMVESVADVRPYYAAADVSITPSRSESLGGASEASAMCVPIVASNVGGLPELVVPGVSGWLIEPGEPAALSEALLAAKGLSQTGRMAPMGRAARRLAEARIDVVQTSAAYVEALGEVVAASRT